MPAIAMWHFVAANQKRDLPSLDPNASRLLSTALKWHR